MEQLQVELAAAIRSNDVLKSEVQNALDNFSCINHKMKEVELQVNLNSDFLFFGDSPEKYILFFGIRLASQLHFLTHTGDICEKLYSMYLDWTSATLYLFI